MSELPTFVREAWAEEATEDETATEALETLANFSELLGSDDQALALWPRLEEQVSGGALRYAPFFDELGALFALDEAGVVRELERAANPRDWSLTPFSGVRLFRVGGGPALGAREAYLVRLAKHARVPRHRHPGEERTFVLEGGYREDTGREFHAGDSVREAPGKDFHSLEVIGGEPCVIALQLEHRFVFEAAFYRAFLGLFWR